MFNKFRDLNNNPPKLNFLAGSKEFKLELISAMCDNRSTLTASIDESVVDGKVIRHGISLRYTFGSFSNIQCKYDYDDIKWAIEENVVGLKQIAPHHKINKFDLLQLFNEIFRENKLTIIEDNHYKVDKSLLSIVTQYTYNVPGYREMLIKMKEWIKSKKIYKYEI